MPHGVDGGVSFVENNEEGWGDDALCQCFTVQVLPEKTKTIFQNTLLFNYSNREQILFLKKRQPHINFSFKYYG